MKLPQIKTVRLTKSYIAPSFNTNREAVYPLLVLSAYLGEGETSKLYKKLVLEEKNALGVSVAYDLHRGVTAVSAFRPCRRRTLTQRLLRRRWIRP